MKPMRAGIVSHFKRYASLIFGLSLLLNSALPVLGQDPAYPDLDPPDADDTPNGLEEGLKNASAGDASEPSQASASLCVPSVAPFKADRRMRAEIATSLGTLCCTLFAGEYPMTVLNFRALARDKIPWTDAQGKAHTEAYYSKLPFGARIAGAYVLSSLRPEGSNFVVVDESCQRRNQSQPPAAGDLMMVQSHPGMASTQFMLLARDQASFWGMYPVFGHCGPLETIDALTRRDAKILEIFVDDNGACEAQP